MVEFTLVCARVVALANRHKGPSLSPHAMHTGRLVVSASAVREGAKLPKVAEPSDRHGRKEQT